MKKLIISCATVFVTACGSIETVNQFNLNTNNSAYIVNTKTPVDSNLMINSFKKVNGVNLKEAKLGSTYVVPVGENDVCIKIVLIDGQKGIFTTSEKFKVNFEIGKTYHVTSSLNGNDVTFGIEDTSGKQKSSPVTKPLYKQEMKSENQAAVMLVPFYGVAAISQDKKELNKCGE